MHARETKGKTIVPQGTRKPHTQNGDMKAPVRSYSGLHGADCTAQLRSPVSERSPASELLQCLDTSGKERLQSEALRTNHIHAPMVVPHHKGATGESSSPPADYMATDGTPKASPKDLYLP